MLTQLQHETYFLINMKNIHIIDEREDAHAKLPIACISFLKSILVYSL